MLLHAIGQRDGMGVVAAPLFRPPFQGGADVATGAIVGPVQARQHGRLDFLAEADDAIHPEHPVLVRRPFQTADAVPRQQGYPLQPGRPGRSQSAPPVNSPTTIHFLMLFGAGIAHPSAAIPS